MQFKPTQQQAIDHLGSNVIVPASAGAGKTAVLIERLMKRILIDKVELDEICAMTFTEAAASEMKVRLMKALNKKQQEEPSDFVTKQISLLETAHISTIHSFCLNIVKNYGYIIGVNPDRTQNILPPAELTILKETVIKEVLDQYIKTHFDEAKTLLEIFSSNPLNFSALESAIMNVADWISEQSQPQQAIDTMLKNYQINSFDDLSEEYQSFFLNYYNYEIQQIINAFELTTDAADKAMDMNPKEATQEQIEVMKTKHYELIQLHTKIKNRDFSFYDDIIHALDIRIPTIQKDEDYKAATSLLEKGIKTLVKRHHSSQDEIKLINEQYPIIIQLIELAQTFITQLNVKKKELKALDFSDFEPMALAILQAENGAIATLMKNQFKEIMVDEFQDTNTYQDEIIKLISNGHNIFRVGDVKQAIYGFRGGKPAIMQQIIANKEAEMIPISYNFRSKYDIVNFNNITFKEIMDLTVNTKYTPEDTVEAGTSEQSKDSHKVEFHIVKTDVDLSPEQEPEIAEDDEISEEPELNIDPADVISAQYIAQKIIDLVSSGEAKFKDITILVRAHHLKDLLKDAFDKVNIPYFLNEQSGFYKSEVVAATIHILKYLNTNNNYDLTKILMSPFYNLSLDQIAETKLSHEFFYDGVKLNFPNIHQQLSELKNAAQNEDIVSLIQRIVILNNAYNQVFSIQDKTNMDALLDKSIIYQNNNAVTITGFISYLESLVDEKSSEASPIASDEDVVTAMTIHQSKGLQFPIVFLFGLGRHTSRESREFLVSDDDLGIVLNHINLEYRQAHTTLLRRIMTYKRSHEDIEESMRLLYVALTRAQNKMFIVDAVKEFTDEHQHAALDESLLFTHPRKIHLLVPASKDTAIVETLLLGDMPTASFPSVESSSQVYHHDLESNLNFETIEELWFENTELNLDRSYIEAMEYGTHIHELIESLPNQVWSQSELTDISPRYHSALTDYNQHQLTQEIYQSHDEFHHELTFLVEDEGEILNGIMDYVAVSESKVSLIDFKTDNADVETIKDRYTDQIERYKKALSILYPGLQLNTFIYSFYLKDYISL